jgi:hypothetical protein
MNLVKNILPFIAINYFALAVGYLVLKYVVSVPAILLVAIAVASVLSSYLFVKYKKRYMCSSEAWLCTLINGFPIFYAIAFVSNDAYQEPYTGWLIRSAALLIGGMAGFGFYGFMYFSRNIWVSHVENS